MCLKRFKMNFADSVELDTSVSIKSEAIPMIDSFRLSDIWLPSHLFQNRKRIVDNKLNKRGIFHTLEKPVVTDCFSIYPSQDESNTCSIPKEDSLDDFSYMLDLLNDCSPTVSLKDSTEEIYNSGDDEAILKNAGYHKENCNHAGFYSTSCHSSNILSHQSESIEIESQCNVIKSEIEEFQAEIKCNIPADDGKPSDCNVEDVIKYSIAYQKPAIEETVGKQKKKKKKAPKKKKMLNVFSVEDNCNDYNKTLVDEFYEHVMREQHRKSHPTSYASEYPTLNKESTVN